MVSIEEIIPQFNLKQFNMKNGNSKVEKKDSKTDGLGDRQKLVYETLRVFTDGATAKELSVHLYNDGKVMSNERNSVHPRLNELISIGMVKVTGKKTCQYTNKKVSIYKIV